MLVHRTQEVLKDEQKLYRDFISADKYINWVSQPHTILALIASGSILLYVALTRDESRGFESNVKYGLGALILCYLFISAFLNKDGLFIRPNPVIWRVVMGAGVLYLMLLVFLLFQTVDDVRWLLSKVDPKLGKPLPERNYAEDCRVFTPEDPTSYFKNIRDCFYDEFVAAHFFGWFGKALLLRDYWICWLFSISFEILEVSLEHYLPNFAECWWDHIVVDILLCNYTGFWLGLKVCDYFRMKPLNWIARVKPDVEEYKWEILSSWKRLFAVLVLVFVFSMVELNAFFLKFVLWIPPPHPINVVRLIIWWFIGQPGMREYYQWVTDKNCKKFGTASWMCAAMMGMEVLVWFKFGAGMFPNPTPPEIFWSWTISSVTFFLWAVWYFGYYKQAKEKKRRAADKRKST